MRYTKQVLFFVTIFLLAVGLTSPALAQESTQDNDLPALHLLTDFPSQLVGAGESATLDLRIRAGQEAQIVDLKVEDLPDGWTAIFRGKNRVVQSVYVQPDEDAEVDLRVTIPGDTESGEYAFNIVAENSRHTSELPVTLLVEDKVPANLAFEVDLPTLRGRPDTTFRFNTTLKNEGDEDLVVDLAAEAPAGFVVAFKSSGQEVTSLPVEANASKSINVEVDSLFDALTPADSYPVVVTARGGEVEAGVTLVAEVVGESDLLLTTPDDRLSGEIEAGEETPLTLILRNLGSAPAHNITLGASQPSGWLVTFEPEELPEVGPGQQTEVLAKVQPSDKALAGDYMLTFRANPEDSGAQSVEYRATVRTSTLWGIVGIALIAVAVGVVVVAVTRFGRR